MADENVDIIKMDATANDVPSSFNVQGFPTIFWRPKGGSPVNYNVSTVYYFLAQVFILKTVDTITNVSATLSLCAIYLCHAYN